MNECGNDLSWQVWRAECDYIYPKHYSPGRLIISAVEEQRHTVTPVYKDMEDVHSAPLILAVKLLSRDASSHQITIKEVLYKTMHFFPHQGQLHTQYSGLEAFSGRLRVRWGMNMFVPCIKPKSQIAKEKFVKSAALTTRASWATHSSPGQHSCSSTRVFVFASQTDLVVGAFHHTAGAQNLRLGSCCLFVLQVLLSNLENTEKEWKAQH